MIYLCPTCQGQAVEIVQQIQQDGEYSALLKDAEGHVWGVSGPRKFVLPNVVEGNTFAWTNQEPPKIVVESAPVVALYPEAEFVAAPPSEGAAPNG